MEPNALAPTALLKAVPSVLALTALPKVALSVLASTALLKAAPSVLAPTALPKVALSARQACASADAPSATTLARCSVEHLFCLLHRHLQLCQTLFQLGYARLQSF